ncbi:DUF2189 domain-containing protein [Falsiroseomonas sp. HC035]|uniref:DUF2189 domain-containing protein n=1 Tax=Falsiroseomonas sp. HC035 TaxID=3390999 RepID=UPI003D32196F
MTTQIDDSMTPVGAVIDADTQVPPDRPWAWISAGWADFRAMPHIGFCYGGAIVAAGWLLSGLLLGTGIAWAVLPATAGFFLMAPFLGAGMYEASRLREAGQPVTLRLCLQGFRRHAPQLMLLGAALLFLHLFWVRMAGLLFALFFGLGFAPAIEAVPVAMLRSPNLLPFLVVGTGMGFVLATIAFAATAVSIPMLVDRDVSAFEAVSVSIRATLKNWRAMSLWAGLIVIFTAMALVPFFLGLALVLPVIAHATWHAYRDLVR